MRQLGADGRPWTAGWRPWLLPAADLEPVEAVASVIGAVIDLHRDRPQLHRLLLEEAPLSPELRASVRQLEAATVAAFLHRRPDPPADPELTATPLVQAVEAWAHRFVLHPADRHDEDTLVTEAARILAADL